MEKIHSKKVKCTFQKFWIKTNLFCNPTFHTEVLFCLIYLEGIHLLVHSPNAYNNQGWLGPKPRAR